jgi:hypothetical protein
MRSKSKKKKTRAFCAHAFSAEKKGVEAWKWGDTHVFILCLSSESHLLLYIPFIHLHSIQPHSLKQHRSLLMSTEPKLTVLIVGAGLGGILLGALLEKCDIPYIIFERATTVKPLGKKNPPLIFLKSRCPCENTIH